MLARRRDRALAVLLLLHVTAMVAVIGFVAGWWSSGDGKEQGAPPASDQASGVGVDGPTVAPEGALHLVTATPGILAPTETPEDGAEATATRPPPTTTPPPAPATEAPPPPATEAPPAPVDAVEPADFSGRWRIFDVVTEGSNAGETYTFDVALSQDGNRVSGGNGGISMSGTVRGDTALLQYVQPVLGYSGTFEWTMTGPGQASGSFTNSYPNAGTSTLQRWP